MKFSPCRRKKPANSVGVICFVAVCCCILSSGCGLLEKKKAEPSSVSISSDLTQPHTDKDVQQLHAAAEMGDSSALYQLGLIYLQGQTIEQDANKGFEYMRQAALKNHHDAKYRTGLCYAEGLGTPANQAEAAHWMIFAAQQDHADAKNWLANKGIYFESKKKK